MSQKKDLKASERDFVSTLHETFASSFHGGSDLGKEAGVQRYGMG